MSALETSAFDIVAHFGANLFPAEKIWETLDGRPIYADRKLDYSGGADAFFASMPFMTRADLRQNFPQGFLREGEDFAELLSSKKTLIVRTSGTSSDRLQILWDPDWWERQELAALRGNPVIGSGLGAAYREAVLTTPMCSDSVCITGPTPMKERMVDHLLFLNTQHDPSRWSSSDMERMVAELREFEPVALEADPVYLAALARYLRRTGTEPPPLQWIILTYEFVSMRDKEIIRSVMGCPVFEFYGLTEAGVFFLECPAGRHHFCGTDAIVEIIRPEGSLAIPEGVGEVIVTTWGNASTPLLRYRTNDLVSVDFTSCPCGNPGPVVRSFEGRMRDVMTIGGRTITPRMIDARMAGVSGIDQFICAQVSPRSLRIDCVAEETFESEAVASTLRDLAPDLEIRVRRVGFIAPEPSGKYRTVIPL